MNQDLKTKWEELAARNDWNFAIQDGRPYFMKDGTYATPLPTTAQQDKEELAAIISEGSSELAKLIVTCWNNGFKISGPCSGITEAHAITPPHYLHFTLIAPQAVVESLHSELSGSFPGVDHMLRESGNGDMRYDISYHFEKGKGLSMLEADTIFSVMSEKLEIVLARHCTVSENIGEIYEREATVITRS